MTRIAVLTALRLETRAVLAALTRPTRFAHDGRRCWSGAAGPNDVMVLQGGVGPQAAVAAAAALPADVEVLVSAGFAGGLVPTLVAGDLVVPDVIVSEHAGGVRRLSVSDPLRDACIAALTAMARPCAHGALYSSTTVLATTCAKHHAAEAHGAVAVDMESGVLAAAAAARGLGFLAVRAVLDPADLSLEGLPPEIAASWRARARIVITPTVWPLLSALRRHASTASTALTCGLRVALPALPAKMAA